MKDAYDLGLKAGHDWYAKGLATGDWSEPECPTNEPEGREQWEKGYGDGWSDAESAYYAE